MDSFGSMWADLAPVGRDPSTGGYRRSAWTAADAQLRSWFADRAAERGMPCAPDRNGNLWAWAGEPADGAVVTGSHLDSVPDGGAFDGPLGVVSAFLALCSAKRASPSAFRVRSFAPLAFSSAAATAAADA